MALFNYASREISAKIVYYGPGLSGKTTNIEAIHSMILDDRKGKLISLPTETDRTLFFDFLPVELGEIKGFKVRFHLYTVPGQVFYNRTRKLVLQGVDGIVFVADSQVNMSESNLESLRNLNENLSDYGKKLENLPFVVQYNKRDIKDIMTVDDLTQELDLDGIPHFESIAITGEGVKETLMEISKLVFNNLRKTLLLESELGESQEDIGELVGREIEEKFVRQEEEIEEIEMVEELPNEEEVHVDFQDLSGETEEQEGKEQREDEVVEEREEESGSVEEVKEEREPSPEIPFEMDEYLPPEKEEVVPADEIFDEIEIEEEGEGEGGEVAEIPEKEVGVTVEGEGISFLRMDEPYISLSGESVIPAVFLDRDGNEVKIKITVSIEKG